MNGKYFRLCAVNVRLCAQSKIINLSNILLNEIFYGI
jgi:hypothetical protein